MFPFPSHYLFLIENSFAICLTPVCQPASLPGNMNFEKSLMCDLYHTVSERSPFVWKTEINDSSSYLTSCLPKSDQGVTIKLQQTAEGPAEASVTQLYLLLTSCRSCRNSYCSSIQYSRVSLKQSSDLFSKFAISCNKPIANLHQTLKLVSRVFCNRDIY